MKTDPTTGGSMGEGNLMEHRRSMDERDERFAKRIVGVAGHSGSSEMEKAIGHDDKGEGGGDGKGSEKKNGESAKENEGKSVDQHDSPMSGEYEFNISFSFGLMVGFNIYDMFGLEIKPIAMTISTNDSKADLNDGKVTIENSFEASFLSLSYGLGQEQKIDGRYVSSDYKTFEKVSTRTVKTDLLNNREVSYSKSIVTLHLGVIGIQLTKDPKK